ncbi:hypothetical protein [Pandoravirus japonicus]|uniref:Uncharacterized protein n=1 Tax=Pandoravirus japonicus TaxID=2823154 RepID=A0A811BNA5_9VIRU|nr:hypothetical protein [Pandoravirus japonicus]
MGQDMLAPGGSGHRARGSVRFVSADRAPDRKRLIKESAKKKKYFFPLSARREKGATKEDAQKRAHANNTRGEREKDPAVSDKK